MDNNNLNKDFNEFNNYSGEHPPEYLNSKILKSIESDLNPHHGLVFFKLAGIQAFIGALTMLFCPQFNYSLTNNYELFHYFHRTLGQYPCMVICGGIFIGSGALMASYLLNMAEIRKIKDSSLLYYFFISGIFVLGFFFIGAEIYIDLATFWVLGALVSGIAMIKLNHIIRNRFFSNSLLN